MSPAPQEGSTVTGPFIPAPAPPTEAPRWKIPSDWASSHKETPRYDTPHQAASLPNVDEDELARLRGPLSPNDVSIIETGMHEEGQYIM